MPHLPHPRTYGDIDSFVTMLLAACEDPRMNRSLDMLLSAPQERRRAVVAGLIVRLRERDAPRALVDAISCLLNDAVAEKASEVVRRCSKSAAHWSDR